MYAELLRRELSLRNTIYASAQGLSCVRSYGDPSVVVYRPSVAERKHGNFFDVSYPSILRQPEWKHRLNKVHTQARHSLPQSDERWRELDSSTSSDALLMNVFCCPAVTRSPVVALRLEFEAGEVPEFGFRARIPRHLQRVDRTEIDMKLGALLVEAKLTEKDFQTQRAAIVETYR